MVGRCWEPYIGQAVVALDGPNWCSGTVGSAAKPNWPASEERLKNHYAMDVLRAWRDSFMQFQVKATEPVWTQRWRRDKPHPLARNLTQVAQHAANHH